MKKYIFLTSGLLIIVIGAFFLYPHIRGVWPAILGPSDNIVDIINEHNQLPPGENQTEFPLSLPDGFTISVFAKDIPGARVMAMDTEGNMWVSQTSEGNVRFLEIHDGAVTRNTLLLKNLQNPHGLAFDPKNPSILYVAEENGISRLRTYSDSLLEKIIDLPAGGRHFTRTLAFTKGNDLLVSIGSSCDTCYEEDARRGSVQVVKEEHGVWQMQPYATGLRNAVFLALNPETGKVWVTEMGRDLLGDDLPPDEINILEQGKNYGWPICYGKNIHDTKFDDLDYIMDPCGDKMPPEIELPAHVAPLGLTFIPSNSTWPKAYWGDLLVSYHGSWNRSEPVGYKIVRFDLDAKGNVLGEYDFISGWLTDDNRALGRPVGLLARPDGVLYVSDDKAGVIYKVAYTGTGAPTTTTVEDAGNPSDKSDLIHVDMPKPNSVVNSPLTISGEARGTWYFEATFPVELRDANGKVLAAHYATATDDWMTENFVPFSVTLTFDTPTTETGDLILHKDNPSGLPEHDDELRIPVRFE